MSSTCGVAQTTHSHPTNPDLEIRRSPTSPISYEGRVSVLPPDAVNMHAFRNAPSNESVLRFAKGELSYQGEFSTKTQDQISYNDVLRNVKGDLQFQHQAWLNFQTYQAPTEQRLPKQFVYQNYQYQQQLASLNTTIKEEPKEWTAKPSKPTWENQITPGLPSTPVHNHSQWESASPSFAQRPLSIPSKSPTNQERSAWEGHRLVSPAQPLEPERGSPQHIWENRSMSPHFQKKSSPAPQQRWDTQSPPSNGQRLIQDDSGVSPGTIGSSDPGPSESPTYREKMESDGHASPVDSDGGHFSDSNGLAIEDEGDHSMEGDAMMESDSEPSGDALSRLQKALEKHGALHPGDKGDGEVFQCHLCSYSGTSRFHFNSHMNTHFDVRCSKCDFTTRTESKLRQHMLDSHNIQLDENDDESIRVPRVNAQGKVKTFKCKQCTFVAVTKMDFWEHSRTHIKPEKMLQCTKCPFVTEYKHHLEYHMRNHFGSKPFKCNKCSYSCVNKSMLNSHMKSHSNIYQYRCADCTYATKYCHSLKLHLRKYNHKPAMVLTNDGATAPAMVDLYSPRRGPRPLKKEDSLSPFPGLMGMPPGLAGLQGLGQSPPMPFGFPFPFLNSPANGRMEEKEVREDMKCALCGFSSTNSQQYAEHILSHSAKELQPGKPMKVENGVKSEHEDRRDSENLSMRFPGLPLPMSGLMPGMKEYLSRMLNNPLLFNPLGMKGNQHESEHEHSPKTSVGEHSSPSPCHDEQPSGAVPLDLSREVRPKPHSPSSDPSTDSPRPHLENQRIPVKNRRKGKAFKLERVNQWNSHEEQRRDSPSPDLESERHDHSNGDWGACHQCQYCDIAFKDAIMYTMHMGYHGYQDPFTCNMCGQQTADKLSFFLHLARSQHN